MVEEEEVKKEEVLFLQPHLSGGDTQLSRLAQLEARRLREKQENTPKDSCAAKTGNWQAARSVAPSTFDASASRTHFKTR